MNEITEWNTPFDSHHKYTRSDFNWMLGIKVKNTRRILAARNNMILRVIGKGPKRYPIDLCLYDRRLNVAVSKWTRRIIYVDGIY